MRYTPMTAQHAYLVLNGSIQVDFIKEELTEKTPIFCTDGACNSLLHTPLNITGILGDHDSVNTPYGHIEYTRLSDQNQTDYEKTINYLAQTYRSIDVYGASGRSMDHYLDIISVTQKNKGRLNLTLIDEYNHGFFPENPVKLKHVKNKFISVIPMPYVKKLTGHGLRYSVKHLDLEFGDSTGIRNHAVHEEIELAWEDGCIMLFVENIKRL